MNRQIATVDMTKVISMRMKYTWHKVLPAEQT